MAGRDYFTFYRSFFEQISDCGEPTARLEMYEVLLNYAFNKTEPDFKNGHFHSMTRFFWKGARAVMAKNWAQFENGCKGGAPIGNTNNKGKKKVNPKLTQSQAYKDKEEDKDKDKDKDKEGEGDNIFRPPSLEDVLNYCSSTHATDGDGLAKKFFNHYARQGWVMGNGMQMTDWQAAFESWCDKETEFNHKNTHNDEDDSTTSEQRSAELEQLRSEQRAAEARIAGEVRGA